ncbi:nucleotidyltransferase family protein [bacterium]|nr:nucleotidyltransferase family protein [bacterium]
MKLAASPQVDCLLLAAGFGSRLKELTRELPKPLLQVKGRALIDWNLDLIAAAGIKQVYINLHYLPDKIRQHVGDGSKWGLRVNYSFEPKILNTGGAIKNLEHKFTQALILTINSDALLGRDFSLQALIDAHETSKHRPVATLAVRVAGAEDNYSDLGLTSERLIGRFLNVEYDSLTGPEKYIYLGVQVLNRELLKTMPTAENAFSITQDTYVRALASGQKLQAYPYGGYWRDVGTPERLAEANLTF